MVIDKANSYTPVNEKMIDAVSRVWANILWSRAKAQPAMAEEEEDSDEPRKVS